MLIEQSFSFIQFVSNIIKVKTGFISFIKGKLAEMETVRILGFTILATRHIVWLHIYADFKLRLGTRVGSNGGLVSIYNGLLWYSNKSKDMSKWGEYFQFWRVLCQVKCGQMTINSKYS